MGFGGGVLRAVFYGLLKWTRMLASSSTLYNINILDLSCSELRFDFSLLTHVCGVEDMYLPRYLCMMILYLPLTRKPRAWTVQPEIRS